MALKVKNYYSHILAKVYNDIKFATVIAEPSIKQVTDISIPIRVGLKVCSAAIKLNLNILLLAIEPRGLNRMLVSIGNGGQIALAARNRLQWDTTPTLEIIKHLVFGVGIKLKA